MWDGRIRRISKCWGKETFTRPGLALKIVRRDRNKKGQMEVYRCQHCSGWHIGTLRHVRRQKHLTAGKQSPTNLAVS